MRVCNFCTTAALWCYVVREVIPNGTVMSGQTPADQGLFSALHWSWVRSCLRPLARRIGPARPYVLRSYVALFPRSRLTAQTCLDERPLIKGYFRRCTGRGCGHVFGLLRG